MFGGIFQQSHFLQAAGWGILHSLWQTALLWILYKIITADNEKSSSASRYIISLLCLSSSLVWFILTVAKQYWLLENGSGIPVSMFELSNLLAPPINAALLTFLSFLYFVMLAIYVLQFGGQCKALHKFRSVQLVKPPVEIRLFTSQASFRLGVKKEVVIWLSHKIDAPFVTGFFKPVILLPFSLLNHLSTAQAEAVILHELAHVKRNDYLVNLFQLIAEKLLFFSPFARLLSDVARAERENCCDDQVLNFRFNKQEYAHALLQVEQLRNQQLTLAMSATAGKKKLLKRIKRIMVVEPVTGFSLMQKASIITTLFSIFAIVLLLLPAAQRTSTTAVSPVIIAKEQASPAFQILKQIPARPNTRELIATVFPEVSAPEKKQVVVKETVQPANIHTEEATTVMLNEELLETPAERAINFIPVNDQPAAQTNVLMVRVEEEVGGSTEKKVYYMQLSNTNGQTAVKPLAFISQPVIDSSKAPKTTARQAHVTDKKRSLNKAKAI